MVGCGGGQGDGQIAELIEAANQLSSADRQHLLEEPVEFSV